MDQTAKDDLMQPLRLRSMALVDRDLGFFEQLLAEDFCYTNASGQVFNKTTYLDFFINSGQMIWRKQELDDITIHWYGEIAIVVCKIYDQASYQGQPFAGHFRSTQVLKKTAGSWQYLTGQTTAIT
ncbi:MAG: DUF4440 domain-containing protein [Anaerolineae bacterium]|nr:DUF4440 domain-containing protein [Anaerolineae bacterium]